ncbi:MAG: S53 family peptidase [Chloroflexota bacterium]|nr:S53 family peptidase [Chloroflexota bacterium]
MILLIVALLMGAFTFQLPMSSTRARSSAALVALMDMIPPQLASSRLLGSVDTRQRIALSLGLRPRNALRLQGYLNNLHFPQTSQAHNSHFAAPENHPGMFSPDATVYSELARFLQGQGFAVTREYTHRLLLGFSGTIAQVERAFHVTIYAYSGQDGQKYFANNNNPLIPAQFAGQVLAINGLNNALHWHTHAFARRLASTKLRTSQCPGHNSQYMTPDQFASAYNLNGLYRAHYAGEGQTLALFELSPFAKSDLATYNACFGHSHTKIQAIQTGATQSDAGMMETEMDAELVLSAAPHLGTLKIYEAGNNTVGYLSQWARIIQDAPPVVSTSWGLCEQILNAPFIAEENTLFALAAAQGQTLFASTGDTGSAGCLGNAKSSTSLLNVDDPAAQPLVTSVGGTSLTLSRASGYNGESVWNTSSLPPASFIGASGGGISHYWTRPSWQQMGGVKNAYSSGKVCKARAGAICRETPDVSLQADTSSGYIIYCSARATKSCSNDMPWNVVGGTSVATPLWAVLAALTNEMLQKQGAGKLGFLNPLLYQIASNRRTYRACFHDVTKGNNDYNGLNAGRYPATVGYDMATGLGSYNADALAHNLIRLVRARRAVRSP